MERIRTHNKMDARRMVNPIEWGCHQQGTLLNDGPHPAPAKVKQPQIAEITSANNLG